MAAQRCEFRTGEFRESAREQLGLLESELNGVATFGDAFLETFADYATATPDEAARFEASVQKLKTGLAVLAACRETVRTLRSQGL